MATTIDLKNTMSLHQALASTNEKMLPLPKTLLSPYPLPTAINAQYTERGGIIILITEGSDNAQEIPNIYGSAIPDYSMISLLNMRSKRASMDIRIAKKGSSHRHVYLSLIYIYKCRLGSGLGLRIWLGLGLRLELGLGLGVKLGFFIWELDWDLRLSAMTRRYCVITHQEVYVWVGLVYDD